MRKLALVFAAVMLAFASGAHAQKFTLKVLYQFAPPRVGPTAPLLVDKQGNIYGTTNGRARHKGTVFELTPDGTFKILYRFCQRKGCTDGSTGKLVMDAAGNIYGTGTGGIYKEQYWNGAGVVFEIMSDGTERALHTFCSWSNCTDGAIPMSGLVADRWGNLYGVTTYGGSNDRGVAFRVTPSGDYTVLYNFCSLPNCADGAEPMGPLIVGRSGALYGATEFGGSGRIRSDVGLGTVFRLAPDGAETVVYNFCLSDPNECQDGAFPEGGLVFGKGGSLYGMAPAPSCCVVLYSVTTGGTEMVLKELPVDHRDRGGARMTWLVRDKAGNLYGTNGVAYELTRDGELVRLTGPCGKGSGYCVSASVLSIDTKGNLYAVAAGRRAAVIYELVRNPG